MSLEAVIQENTAVMRELIARLTAATSITTVPAAQAIEKPVTAVVEIVKEQAKAEAKVEAPAEVAEEAKKPAATPVAAETPAATPEAVAESPSEVTYDQVKDCIKEMAKKSRDMAIGALKEFGATKGPELKPEQFAAFVAHSNKLLGAA